MLQIKYSLFIFSIHKLVKMETFDDLNPFHNKLNKIQNILNFASGE